PRRNPHGPCILARQGHVTHDPATHAASRGVVEPRALQALGLHGPVKLDLLREIALGAPGTEDVREPSKELQHARSRETASTPFSKRPADRRGPRDALASSRRQTQPPATAQRPPKKSPDRWPSPGTTGSR